MKTDGISTITVQACVNTACTPVIEYEPLNEVFALGVMQWEGEVGKFKYEWPLQHLDRDDLVGLKNAITTMLAITEGVKA